MSYAITDGWYTGEAADEILRSIDEADDRDWSDAYEQAQRRERPKREGGHLGWQRWTKKKKRSGMVARKRRAGR